MNEVTLYDAYNRPIKKQDLVREFAAPTLTGIRTIWTNGVAAGLTPQRLAALLQNAADDDPRDYLTLAEEMEEREPHYASVLGTRKRAVTRLPLTVEAASDDANHQAHADAVRELVKRGGTRGLMEDLLDALGKSHSAVEIMWDRSGSQWYPDRYEHRDPRFFIFDRIARRELRLLDDSATFEGLPLPPYKFIVHIPRLKSGIPIRGGLARLVAWSYMAKMYTFKDWLAFVEIFGMPLRIGKYGPNANDKDIEILKTAVANLGSDAAAVLPDSMKIEFEKQAQTTGADNLFQGLAEWIDKQISKAVLGQTMTADDGSSQAQAKVHDEVRSDIRDSDAEQLEETLNLQLVRPFIDLNYGPQKSYPELKLFIKEPEDIAALTTALKELVPLGLRVEQSVVRDKIGLPDPPPDAKPEDLLGNQGPGTGDQGLVTAQNRPAHQCPHCSTALNVYTNSQSPVPDVTDGFASRLAAEAAPHLDAMIDRVRTLVMEGESLQEIRDKMFDLYDDMDAGQLGEVMAKALTASHLAGRAEVADGD